MANLNQSPFFGMQLPRGGTQSYPFFYNFATQGAEQSIDFSQQINQGLLEFISGVYIDNWSNSEDLTLLCGGTNQTITCPANSQGYFPLIVANPPIITVTNGAASGSAKLYFYNVPMIPFLIQAPGGGGGGNVNIDEIGGNPVTTSLPVEIVAPDPLPVSVAITAPTLTDYSLALSGASETLVAAGDAENYFSVVNPVGNNPISVNLAGGDASVSGIPLPAGGSITIQPGIANAITIDGTSAETVTCFAG